MEQLMKFLADKQFSLPNKVRVIVLAFLKMELNKDDQKELLQYLSKEQQSIVRNLSWFNAPAQNPGNEQSSKTRITEQTIQLYKNI